jgi:Rod binding domain-containing protein
MRPLVAPRSSLAHSWNSSLPKQNQAKLTQCAKEFEGMLLEQMLRSARESGGSSLTGEDDEDDANSTVLDMGEQQFAQALAASGALGIGKMVIAGLTKNAD